MAASIRVRSCTKRSSRVCMRLNAWMDSRTSVGPSSRSGSMSSPRPSRSALAASCLSGRVARRNSQIIRPITRLATSIRLRVVCQDQLADSLSTSELNCSQPPRGSWMEPYSRMSCGGGIPLRSFIIRLWCCQARLRWASCLSSALISTIRVRGSPAGSAPAARSGGCGCPVAAARRRCAAAGSRCGSP